MLILENLFCLKFKLSDVTAAILHATLEDEKVYLEMPLGFNPCAFWKYLTEKLGNCCLPQTPFDPCLIIGKKIIAICHVDDLMFWVRNENDTVALAAQLQSKVLNLSLKGPCCQIPWNSH
ncbi:hypothetical protein ACHAXS_000091 [Conticribra weissflogii]